MADMPATTVGQVSADGQFRWDGQQWVPIPRGEREPTAWTRPMQLAAAGLLAAEAVISVAVFIAFYNHDAVKKALAAAGAQLPQGMSEDQYISITIASVIGFSVFLALLELFGALGALLRWRWAFWYVLVLMALGSLSAIIGIGGLLRPAASSPIPIWATILEELLAVGAVAMFAWMLIGLIRFGPWAMKRPGVPT